MNPMPSLFGDPPTAGSIPAGFVERGAFLSANERYRYDLWRTWDRDKPVVCWIMLNPSTADALEDDPTIRRCIGFAKRWNYGGIVVVNLFAFRSANPADMKAEKNPVGDYEADDYITGHAASAGLVVAAWGVHGCHKGRDKKVMRMLSGRVTLHCLGKTKDGYPRHPLYLAADTPLEVF